MLVVDMSARKKKKNKGINLLHSNEFANSMKGRVLTWVLSSFRIIVIVTEMIVLVAFLSRFYFDSRSNDLKDEIKQKQAIISASSDFEQTFRDTQKRLNIVSDNATSSKSTARSVQAITSNLPSDIQLERISINGGEAQVAGLSPNELSIQQLMVNLEASPQFSNTSLNEVDTDFQNSQLLYFRVSAVIN